MIRSLWLGVGWLGIVAAFVFSLGPASTLPDAMQHDDKLVHLASYASLMLWWAQLYPSSLERMRLAIALVMLGILIEWLQSFTATRQAEVLDALANTCGILLGWGIAHYSLNLLGFFSRCAVKSGGK